MVKNDEKIAIVGLGVRYPDAKSPLELWENLLAKRVQFRKIPKKRFPLDEYFDENPETKDKTYIDRAAVIDDYEFDWVNKRIPKQTYDSTDVVQWLALDVTLNMLEDANIKPDELPKDTTMVVLGNTLVGDTSRSQYFRLRWPFVKKVLTITAKKMGLGETEIDSMQKNMEKVFKSVFPDVNEDTIAGGLANTIAGRICNYLNLKGGGYIVDGACASSLLAIFNARDKLLSKEVDFAIVGGVDMSLDTFELIGFSKAGALTKSHMRVYDKRGDGFIPGEGCGIIGLKRLSDAKKDNNKIYAIIDGCGVSTDGKSGIATPTTEGQFLALTRAYKNAHINPSDLDFIEGHGTGTKVGDFIELMAIDEALSLDPELKEYSCGITSFKSLIGHTKAAAGIAGVIKTAIALNQRIIPSIASTKIPHPVFSRKKSIYPILENKIYDKNKILKAGVSSMGFGGINTHIVLSSSTKAPYEHLCINNSESFYEYNESEIFFITAIDKTELFTKINNLIEEVEYCSYAELIDLSKETSSKIDLNNSYKIAFSSDSPKLLLEKLSYLKEILEKTIILNTTFIDEKHKIYISHEYKFKKPLGFVFPSQGSQQLNSVRDIIRKYEWARELLEEAKTILNPEIFDVFMIDQSRLSDEEYISILIQKLKNTKIAQPIIVLSSILYFNHLKRLGIKSEVVCGHSLGELTALYANDTFSLKEILELAQLRGELMSKGNDLNGMLSLMCNKDTASELIDNLEDCNIEIANINTKEQTIVSGENSQLEKLMDLVLDKSIRVVKLPVSNAFHSSKMKEASIIFKDSFDGTKTISTENMISSIDGSFIPKDTNVGEYLSDQIIKPIDFISTSKKLEERCELVLEVGVSNILSKLINANTSKNLSFPTCSKANSINDLNNLLSYLFVLGYNIDFEYLFSNRIIRKYTPSNKLKFIENPCESDFPTDVLESIKSNLNTNNYLSELVDIPKDKFNSYLSHRKDYLEDLIKLDMKYYLNKSEIDENVVEIKTDKVKIGQQIVETKLNPFDMLKSILVEMTSFPEDTITKEMKIIDDLNFDSIKVGEFITKVIDRSKIKEELNPNIFVEESLEKIASYLETFFKRQEKSDSIESIDIFDMLKSILVEMTSFPEDTITKEMKIIDDLNFDSIKVGEFITKVIERTKINEELNPNIFIEESLEKIASYLDTFKKEPQKIEEKMDDSFQDNWVREYEQNEVLNPLDIDLSSYKEIFSNNKVQILCDKEVDLANNLANSFKEFNIEVKIDNYSTNELLENIIIIPNTQKETLLDKESIVEALNYVSTPIHSSLVSVTYLQFKNHDLSVQTKCAKSYVATLHLERKNLKTRVISVDNQISIEKLSKAILEEQLVEQSYIYSIYDKNKNRYTHESLLTNLKLNDKRYYQLSNKDIVLVTGGGKGITAECAFELAKKTGVTLVLLGSSKYTSNESELSKNLERLTANNIRHKYYQCNVTDEIQVSSVIEDVKKNYGDVTCIVHGSGVNNFSRTGALKGEYAFNDVAPKVMGIINLLNTLGSSSLKLIVGLSSVIGITGMPGNSLYAFSNQMLSVILEEYSYQNNIDTISLGYSVWADVGMGVKTGSLTFLENIGILAIPASKGIQKFLDAVEYKNDKNYIAVASKLGGLDTWTTPAIKEERLRFVKEAIYFEKDVEILTKIDLSLEEDLYLLDHKYNKTPIMPTVFSLEAMAQAVSYLVGEEMGNIQIEDIELIKPLIVFPSGVEEVFISAIKNEKKKLSDRDVITVVLSSSKDSIKENAYVCATFILGDETLKKSKEEITKVYTKSSILPEELYSNQLFQGKLFQRIEGIYKMDSDEVICDATYNKKSTNYFNHKENEKIIIKDPFFLDAMLQSSQLTEINSCLPIKIKSLKIYDFKETPCFIKSTVIVRDEQKLESRVVAYDKQGNIIVEMMGYDVKKILNGKKFISPEDFINPTSFEQNKLENLILDIKGEFDLNTPNISLYYIDNLDLMKIEQRHTIQEKLLKNDGLELYWEDKKPMLKQNEEISISHKDSYMIVSLSKAKQSCDLENIESRDISIYETNLKGFEKYKNLFNEIEDTNISYTRLWTIYECLHKCDILEFDDIKIIKQKDKSILFEIDVNGKKVKILSLVLSLIRSNEKVLSFIVDQKNSLEKSLKEENLSTNSYLKTFDDGKKQHCYRLRVPFKDVKLLQRVVDYPSFAFWIGNARESALLDISQKLIEDMLSEKYAWVTNYSKIKICGIVTSFDLLEARVWTSKRFGSQNSSNTLHFDWIKIDKNGEKSRVAFCEMATTWTKIISHSVVEAEKYPKYLEDFITSIEMDTHNNEELVEKLPEDFSDVKYNNELLYQAKNEPIIKPVLMEYILETSLYESNLVGNIYFAHYYEWQKIVVDKFMYSILSQRYKHVPDDGELMCVNSEVNHLREAMPFYKIKVTLHLNKITKDSIDFSFNYYSIDDEENVQKIANGSFRGMWMLMVNENPTKVEIPKDVCSKILDFTKGIN